MVLQPPSAATATPGFCAGGVVVERQTAPVHDVAAEEHPHALALALVDDVRGG